MSIQLKSDSKEDIVNYLNNISKLTNKSAVSRIENSNISLVNFFINLKETNLYPMSEELTLELFKSSFIDPSTILSNAMIGFLETMKTKICFMEDYGIFLKKWIEVNPKRSKEVLPFLFNIGMQSFIKEEIKDILYSYLRDNKNIPFEYLKLDRNPEEYYKANHNQVMKISPEIRNSKNISELSIALFGRNSKSLRKTINKYILINNDINYDFFLLSEISNKLNLSIDEIVDFYENYDFQYFFNKNKYSYLCTNKIVLHFLIKNFPSRIIRIINSSIENRHIVELEEMIRHSEEINYQLPKKPKSFIEIHNYINYQYRIKEQPDHPLNQDNIYSWTNDKIISDGVEYSIFIPRTNHDLIYSGFKMINCIGNGDYAPDLRKGLHNIFFLKDKNEFKVCVFIQGERLNSAKGKRNNQIDPILMLDIKKYLLKKNLN